MSNILYTNFHYGEGGGHTTYILSLLKNQRHNKFVACPPTSLLYKTLYEQGCDKLIPVEFPGKLKQYKAIVRNTMALSKAVVKYDIDIIHTNGSSDNRMALYASLICKKKFKVVFTKHNTIKINNIVSRLRLSKFNDAVIFVGHFLDIIGLDKNYSRFHVIENGVDLEYWKKRESISTGNSLTLVSTAGAARHKGWQHLIEAISGLSTEDKDRLKVVLLARHEVEMEKELAEAGQYCEFVFPGFQGDTRPYLEKVDIGFVLSYKEACSFACREMLSMGLPVMVSDFMTLANDINENCGWVTKLKDADSVREALRAILAMPPERISAMKAAAEKRAVEHFSIERMIGRTNDVYEAISGN